MHTVINIDKENHKVENYSESDELVKADSILESPSTKI